MTELRKVLWLACAAMLLGSSVVVGAASLLSADENKDSWALEIIHKEIGPSNEELRVVVRNSSEDLDITAFEVEMVYGHPDGRGGGKSKAEDRLLGEPLRPGETTEVTFGLMGGPYEALTVRPHFEILSDNSSRGDSDRIDEFFLERTHYAYELQRVLAELRSARWNKAGSTQFFARQAEFADSARAELSKSMQARTEVQAARWGAIKRVASIVEQVEKRIQEGEPEAEALSLMEWLLEDELLPDAMQGVRAEDLRKLASQEGGAR